MQHNDKLKNQIKIACIKVRTFHQIYAMLRLLIMLAIGTTYPVKGYSVPVYIILNINVFTCISKQYTYIKTST